MPESALKLPVVDQVVWSFKRFIANAVVWCHGSQNAVTCPGLLQPGAISQVTHAHGHVFFHIAGGRKTGAKAVALGRTLPGASTFVRFLGCVCPVSASPFTWSFPLCGVSSSASCGNLVLLGAHSSNRDCQNELLLS